MVHLNPRNMAAECDRAIEVVADPERRLVLQRLRSVWMALCNGLSVVDAPVRADQLSIIAQIHTELLATCKTAMH
jgi:hypothetical protein